MPTVSATPASFDGRALRYRRNVSFLAMVAFVCPNPGAAQNLEAVPTVRESRTIRLPVIDQQDIRFERVSVAEGLSPSTMVTAMVEDNQGFIWFGTRNGLNRYDGYKFKLFTHEPGSPGSLSGVYVHSLFKDRSGRLWIGSDQYLDRFDPNTETFTHYSLDADPNGPRAGVLHISEDRAGMMWLATENGLRRLDPLTGKITSYHHDPNDPSSLSSSYLRSTGEDKAGGFWVATREGVDRFDRDTGKVTLHVPLHGSLSASFYEDSTGVFWIFGTSGNGLAVLDRKTNRLTRYSFAGLEPENRSRVLSMLEDRAGDLWFGTGGEGLLKLDRKRRAFVRYRNPGNPDSLSFNLVDGLLQDREGNIWIRSRQGIHIFATRKPLFERLWQQARSPGGPDGRDTQMTRVNSIIEDRQGSLWMGIGSALIRLDRKAVRYTTYQIVRHVRAVLEDASGTLWVGTGGQGVMRFDRATGRFHSVRDNAADNAFVYGLVHDRSGVMWVVTTNDLKRLDPATERLTGYLPRAESGGVNPRSSPRSRTSIEIRPISATQDRQGVLWIGTNDAGLYRLDLQTHQLARYQPNPADPYALSNSRVNSVFIDQSNRIWVATQNGLNQLDLQSGRFTSYYERDGLAGNTVSCILEDDRGDLWMSTNKGVSRFNPQTKAFRNYTVADGLPGPDLTAYPACFKSASGEMFFGGFDGAAAFHPDRAVERTYVPPVVLTDFRLFGKQVEAREGSPLNTAITHTTALTLTHKQNSFSLGFSALNYLNAATTRYRYKLERLDEQWNEVGSDERLVTYPATPPGEYTFRVQAASGRGKWNEPGTVLRIDILPPWWATWWFRSIAFLSVACLAFAAYRWRVRSLHLAASRLECQVAERTRELRIAKEAADVARDAADSANRAKSSFLANMSHELRTPLNAILGFSSLLRDDHVSEKQRRDLDIINHSGEHLLTLINNVLDLAKIEAGRTEVQVEPYNLKRLIAEVTDMMRVRANEKDLALIVIEPEKFPEFVRLDPAKLRQVLINLLGNAIKFTERGTVTLRLESRSAGADGRLLMMFEVEDTGIGIAAEDRSRIFDAFVQAGKQRNQRGTGLGLTISRQFVELMGGSIHVDSAPGKGSRFRVELPLDAVAEPQMKRAEAVEEQIAGVYSGGSGYRILIVEDREENWLVLQRLMQKTGFESRIAEDGARGVELFKTWRPHFIWMDLAMPVMDGKEAARHIRALDGGQDVKIVAVTASAFVSEREEVLAAGIDDFVRKPFQPSEIYDCMARHLGLRRIYAKTPQEEQSSVLTPEDFRELSPDLVRELADAIATLDQGRILEVITRIRARDATLADKLTYFADRFAYTPMMAAVRGHANKAS